MEIHIKHMNEDKVELFLRTVDRPRLAYFKDERELWEDIGIPEENNTEDRLTNNKIYEILNTPVYKTKGLEAFKENQILIIDCNSGYYFVCMPSYKQVKSLVDAYE